MWNIESICPWPLTSWDLYWHLSKCVSSIVCKCLMSNCILHCFIAHFVKKTEMEPKQLAFEDRGYKWDAKMESVLEFQVLVFYLGFSGKLRADLEQELIKSQGYRISALEIYLFVLADWKQHIQIKPANRCQKCCGWTGNGVFFRGSTGQKEEGNVSYKL